MPGQTWFCVGPKFPAHVAGNDSYEMPSALPMFLNTSRQWVSLLPADYSSARQITDNNNSNISNFLKKIKNE
jgi:hypothetical protein